jgi:hypothetical protein
MELESEPGKDKDCSFSKSKVKDLPTFVYDNHKLEVDDSFLHLGITFNSRGTFHQTKAKLVQQARRPMFSLL